MLNIGSMAAPASLTGHAGTLMSTFYACSRFWIVVYGVFLLFHDIFFTIFPTTLLVISGLTLVLHYTKIQPPPQMYVTAVFGINPNIATIPQGTTGSSDGGGLSSFGMSLAFQALTGLGGLNLVTGLASNLFGSLPFQSALTTLNLSSAANTMASTMNHPLINQVTQSLKHRGRAARGHGKSENHYEPHRAPRHDRHQHDTFVTPADTPTTSMALEYGQASLRNDGQMDRIHIHGGMGMGQGSGGGGNGGPSIPIVAHQGAGFDAPENSLPAFLHCKSQGCTFVHFDLKMSRDNVPLLFHDESLHRVAGLPNKFRDLYSSALRNIDISLRHHHGLNFRGTRIPTLEEAVEACLKLNLKFFINILDSNQYMVNAIVDMYSRYTAMYTMAVVTSSQFKLIYDIRRRDSKIIGCIQFPHNHLQGPPPEVVNALDPHSHSFFLLDVFHEMWEVFHNWIIENFVWWYLGLSAVLKEKDTVSKKDVIEWGKKGIRVFIWPVNQPIEKIYFSKMMSVGYLTDTLTDEISIQIQRNKEDLDNNNNSSSRRKGHRNMAMESIPPSPPYFPDTGVKDMLNKAAYHLQRYNSDSDTEDDDNSSQSSYNDNVQYNSSRTRTNVDDDRRHQFKNDQSNNSYAKKRMKGGSNSSAAADSDTSNNGHQKFENFPPNIYTR